ncbi:unnamed protein product [Blepharisma stoltei]|uniref:Uncharacterized protein n=1 Tax=Blepharisma stoltei TaxID=1481888 RepID=A0AAU9J1M2_9CILI|nr:unnamed protein product [Blepharisma stoltei]
MEESEIAIDDFGNISTGTPSNGQQSQRQKIDDYVTNHREFNSLPKLYNGQQFDPFRLFSTFAKQNNLCINIPITLVRLCTVGQPYLVQSNKYGAVTSKQCSEGEFFNLYNGKSDHESPIYCYKTVGHETIFLYTRESAESLWNSTSNTAARIQHFVHCRSKPSSIIRVHWRVGMKSKYFLISNRVKYNFTQKETTIKKLNTITMVSKKKRSNTMMGGDFRYTDMISKTSKSINNPFKVTLAQDKLKHKRTESLMSQNSILNPAFYDKNLCEISTVMSLPNNTNSNIVNPRELDTITVIEDTVKVADIENMVNRITKFLCDNAYRNGELGEMLLDFTCDKDKKWVFLDSKEIVLQQKMLPEIRYVKRADLPPKMKRRTLSYVNMPKPNIKNFNFNIKINQIADSTPKCPYLPSSPQLDESKPLRKMSLTPGVMQSCPFILNSPLNDSQKSGINESDFMEKWHKASKKIDHAVSLKPSMMARLVDAEEQSIRAYQARHIKSDSMTDLTITNSPEEGKKDIHESPASNIHNTSNSLWDNKYNDHINKCFTDVIDKIDEMNMNTELLKIKSRNLVEAYGGDEFWSRFISSLYKKITACDALTKFYEHYNLQTIFNGMFKVFNGCATLDFRRRIKAVHEGMGITEKEFNLYVDIFDSVLREHDVKDEDIHIIMIQIRSMKWLICRGKNNSKLI